MKLVALLCLISLNVSAYEIVYHSDCPDYEDDYAHAEYYDGSRPDLITDDGQEVWNCNGTEYVVSGKFLITEDCKAIAAYAATL